MAATLVAFFAVGFFAATLLPLFRFLSLLVVATLIVVTIAAFQANSLWRILALGGASVALAQIGYGIGLAWVSSTRARCIRD